ncbi:Hypothetical predicted protein [Mytilus galloprovincialis]|uniref:C-type lectin domain-containing protein n=1 Tax=Mytilus galloprovincialis TaxID=29158 RepID=A0A8B6FJJ5_MYTGA|nr:Hypothetical predicted protein [Mytilus galloprovincialis]
MPVCIVWQPAVKGNVDETYSTSRYTLPIFRFEKEFIGQATWSTAINACLHNNGSLSKNKVDFVFNWDYWLPYFRYEEENEPCVAMVKNKNSLSLTYRFRPCSDLLPVLCQYKRVSSHLTTQVFLNHGGRSFGDSTETMFGRTIATTAPNNSDVYGLGIANNEFDLFIRILVGGAAFFATTIIVLLVIIYFQRRKLMKAYFTSLTPRQDENNYNEISETSVGQHYAVEPLYENTASGCHCSVQQNIDQIQHIVTAGYSVHSNVQETIEGHYSTISE